MERTAFARSVQSLLESAPTAFASLSFGCGIEK
jgi:hypothetical protein